MSAERLCIGCGGGDVSVRGDVAICAGCGLRAAAAPQPMDYGVSYSADETLYGEHLRMLDRFQTAPDLRPLLLPFESRIADRIAATAGVRRVVDLGCGTGRFLRAVETGGRDVAGYEVAGVLVERLRRHGRQVQRGGIDEFLASDDRADAISLLEVVEHLDAPGAAIDRLLTEKRPQLLFVVVPQWNTRRRFDSRFADHDVPPNHLTWWNEPSLARLLGRHGYRAHVETVPEKRRSLLGHLARNRRKRSAASAGEWLAAIVTPPPFWLLGTAERQPAAAA